MANASSTTTKKDTVAAVRKDLEDTKAELATALQTITDLHTFAGQLRDAVAAIATTAPQATTANARPTHDQVQREALHGMKEATQDERVIAWCDAALGRIETDGAFGNKSNVWKVVGRRASTPQERIQRLMATVPQTQAAAAPVVPALPALPALPNAGGDTHEEVPPPSEEDPSEDADSQQGDSDVPFD